MKLENKRRELKRSSFSYITYLRNNREIQNQAPTDLGIKNIRFYNKFLQQDKVDIKPCANNTKDFIDLNNLDSFDDSQYLQEDMDKFNEKSYYKNKFDNISDGEGEASSPDVKKRILKSSKKDPNNNNVGKNNSKKTLVTFAARKSTKKNLSKIY